MKNIEEILKYILSNYKELQKEGFTGNYLNAIFNSKIPLVFTKELVLSNKYVVKAGCGKGNFAKIPWICILDKEITKRITEGYYVAILFSEDMSGFYITLNQGFTWFSNRFGEAKGRKMAEYVSNQLREKLKLSYDHTIDLKSEYNLAKGYEATTIYSKYYSLSDIENSNVKEEINKFLGFLNQLKVIISSNYLSFNEKTTLLNSNESDNTFSLKRTGKKAILIYIGDKFILQKGSYISTPSPMFAKYSKAYYEMSLSLYKYLDESRILIKDLEFTSPSAAAAFANGRSTNGRTDWIDREGKTIFEYMKNDRSNRKIILEEFRNFYISNTEEKEESFLEDWIKNAPNIIKEFQNEFPIDRILNLTLGEYCLGIENSRETLSYYLEFGKYKKVGPWIGGGTVKKHGIYFSASENKYKGPDGVIEDVDSYWEEFKKQLYDFIKSFEHDIEPYYTKDRYPLLRDMSMVLTKLLYLYYPYKFINISAKQKLNDAFKIFGYELNEKYPTEQLSYILNKKIREDLNMYDEENPEFLGNAIWNYILFLNKSNSDRNVQYWLYTPGMGGNKWNEYYSQGIMIIENDGLGNFLELSNKNEIRESLSLDESTDKSNSLKNKVLEKWEFSREIKEGDIIFAKKGQSTILGRGVVKSDYIYDEEKNLSYRVVEWTDKGEWDHLESFGSSLVKKTLTNITKYNGYASKLEGLLKQEIIIDQYDRESFLSEMFISPEKYDNMVNTLLRKRNIILQGSPGVGKTFCAKKLMQSIIGKKEENRIFTVQFHQSYSYEDFIQGYRPNDEGKFELKNGLFYDVVKNACKEYENNKENAEKYCIIIDEINRGNLSKIFGELMMLIESDKRSEKWSINLTYSDEKFYIPENLYIIGTMNTADRSLTMVDYALRRRFAFINLEPAFGADKMRNYLINEENVDENIVDQIMIKYQDLNDYITKKIGRGFCIGHSYFIGQFIDSQDFYTTYQEILNYEIKPLIEEYFFDDEVRIKEAIDKVTLKED
jgi:5-methylcytosine-specific restriction protein B